MTALQVGRDDEVEVAGELVSLRAIRLSDAPEFLKLRRDNRSFFLPFEPVPANDHFTLAGQRRDIAAAIDERSKDRHFAYCIYDRLGELVGRVSLSNVYRRSWQNANIGYYIAEEHNNKGYATEAVGLTLTLAFSQLGLHRVQGAAMVRNTPSKRVLATNGFRHEGLARNYLKINGRWEDHDIYAVTAEDVAGERLDVRSG